MEADRDDRQRKTFGNRQRRFCGGCADLVVDRADLVVDRADLVEDRADLVVDRADSVEDRLRTVFGGCADLDVEMEEGDRRRRVAGGRWKLSFARNWEDWRRPSIYTKRFLKIGLAAHVSRRVSKSRSRVVKPFAKLGRMS